MNKKEAYMDGYETIMDGDFNELSERLKEAVNNRGEETTYEEVFTGEPENIVQTTREFMPLELESLEDGRLAHEWDRGAFDALVGNQKKF